MNNWKLRHSFTGNATSDVQTVNGYLADLAYHLTTNLLLQSNQFDTTWVSSNTTETGGQAGYDGSNDAWLLDISGGTSDQRITQSFTANGTHTASIYAKANTLNWMSCRISSDCNIWFDLQNGLVGNSTLVAGFVSANIESVGNGWHRVSLTFNLSGAKEVRWYPATNNLVVTQSSGSIYIQDAQLEEGTQATTYVETTTEPVTLPDTFNVTVVPDGKEYAAPLFIPRTNILLQSNQFDTTWTVAGATATSGQTGYDGTNDAWLFTTTVAGASLEQSITFSGVVVFSMYAKKGTVDGIRLRIDAATDANAYFNLSSGSVHSFTGSAINASITDLGGGWHRCEVSANISSPVKVAVYTTDGTTAYDNGNIYVQDAQLEAESVATEYIPTTTAAVTRDWSAFGRVQNQVPGISNGTHTHTGAASGSGIAATTITGSGSGATFAYDFDTLGVLTTLTADGAGSGYKVGDKLSIDTTEGHTIEFRLVEGSNAATVSVSMGAAKPNKPIPFPVSKMRVEGLTDRTVLFMDERSRYVFPKPTPYLLDTYEGAAAAYSLRRLRSSYTGPAVRVRRASNNDELDIYFNRDGSLDTATLESFCAGTDGFVKVWYDQGQEGNDATQTTTADQPQIVSSGSVVTENGKPLVRFDQDFLSASCSFSFAGANFLVGSNQSGDFEFATSLEADADNQVQMFLDSRSSTKRLVRYEQSGTTSFIDLDSQIPQGTQSLLAYNNDNGTLRGYVDGTAVANTVSFSSLSITQLHLARLDSTSSGEIVDIQECIWWPSDQSSNRTGIEDNINEHYGIYEFSGLLDDYSGAAAAYSLRRLSSTYTGPAIRVVKHDVGYPEMDIPFEDDGTLSVVLLEAFADGYDATVKVWYDQSGGSNHAEQSTLASQPKIVDAGTVITENGLPAAQFDGVNDYFTKAFTLGNPVSHFVVGKVNNTNQFLLDGYGDVNRNSLVSPIPNNMRLYNGGGSIFHPYTPGNRYLFSSISNGANSSLAVNGSNSTGNIGTNPMNGVTIGCAGNLSSIFFMNGTIQEIMVYASDQASNRTAIESNVNDFYSIYP